MAGVPRFIQCLTTQKKAGTLYNTFTTDKSVINPEDVIGPSYNYFDIGTKFKIHVGGGLSNRASTPGTFRFRMMFGSVIVFSTGDLSFNANARTLLPFSLDIDLTVRATGSGTNANMMGMGRFGGIHLTNTDGLIQVPVTAPAVSAGFDSGPSALFDLYCGFSTSDAGNGVQVQEYDVVQLAF